MLALVGAPAAVATSEITGVVFADADADGVRDAGEPGLAGVVVSDGVRLTRTDAGGRYALPGGGDFVFVTRPSGWDAPAWHSRDGGDFGLRPREEPEHFFFVQISDAHVYDRTSDFEAFSSPEMPWYVPSFAADTVTAWMLGRLYDRTDGAGFEQRLREGLAPCVDRAALEDASGGALIGRMREAMAEPDCPLGDVTAAARAAFDEVAALEPAFVVSTGDMVLEGNDATPEAVARWFGFYRTLTDRLGVTVYDTIGNNEIAGIGRTDFPPSHPQYGRHDFHETLGPSHYSFDRGPFHFVALDTHRPAPKPDRPERWRFDRMEADVREWADRDMAAHADRVLVVLNHEPFHWDPAWPMARRLEAGADEGLFDAHGVDYVLSGHIHWRSHVAEGSRHHLTAGALSGMRWVLPATVHPRGYRLLLAYDGRLHSAWKETGRPIVAAAEPALPDARELMIVAADAAGPFRSVEIHVAGDPAPTRAFGRYFFRVARERGEPVTVRGLRADGSAFERRLVGASALSVP